MADFIQTLDPSKLVFFGTVRTATHRVMSTRSETPHQALSAVIAPFSSPAYNLPIFLFGTLVQELPDAPQSLRSVSASFCREGHKGLRFVRVHRVAWRIYRVRHHMACQELAGSFHQDNHHHPPYFQGIARVHGHPQNHVNVISQVPTWLAFANGLRQAGGSFGGLNIGGRDLGGATGMTPVRVSHAIYLPALL